MKMPPPSPKTNINWNIERRIYIGNMGEGANKDEIEDVCTVYGAIKHVWVARKPAGFAFVEFFDRRAAEDATSLLDGKWINGHRVCVEMSTGEPKFTADGRLRVGHGLRRSPTRSQGAPRHSQTAFDKRLQTPRTLNGKHSRRDDKDSHSYHCDCKSGNTPRARIQQGRDRRRQNGVSSSIGNRHRSRSRSMERHSREVYHDRSSRERKREHWQRHSKTRSGTHSRSRSPARGHKDSPTRILLS